MSKRVYVTLADSTHQELERLAKAQGRVVANLAAFLLENAILDLAKQNPPTKKDN